MDLKRVMVRSLRPPGFALAVMLLVAAAVLVNATVFTAVWAVHWKALPYRDGDRLVELRTDMVKFGFQTGLSRPLYMQIAGADDLYEGVTGRSARPFQRSDGSGREWTVQRVTPDFTTVLGVQPMLGRALMQEDVETEASVLLLSEAVWRTRFAASPDIVGREVVLGGQTFEVIGVMPPGFVFPGHGTHAWMPFVPNARERIAEEEGSVGEFEVLARLQPGVTLAQAREHLAGLIANDGLLAGLRMHADLRPVARFWRERLVSGHATALALLQLAALILLVVVAASLANLVLDRMVARQRDLAIFRALGAGGGDIARTVAADLLPPLLLGVLAGLALVPVGLHLLQQRDLVPADLPMHLGGDASPWVVAATTALLLLAVAVLASVAMTGRETMAGGLRTRQQAGGLGRLRTAMLVLQLALATVLLGASALLLASAWNLLDEPRGFDERGVLVTAIDPLGASRGETVDLEAERGRLTAGLLAIRDAVRALPAVTHAALGTAVPFSQWDIVTSLRIPGIEDDMQVREHEVGVDYFAALSIPVLAGRTFTEADIGDASPVVVDELFVRRWLQGRDPLGARVQLPDGPGRTRDAEIIGVVGTVKHGALDEPPSLPTLYVPTLAAVPVSVLVTRVEGDPAALAESVRAQVLARFPQAVLAFNRPLAEAVAQSMGNRRAMLEAVTVFAAVTLMLVAMGLYAVLSLAMRRRTAELGVRMALGASTGRVQRMVLGQGGLLAAAGVTLGLVLGMPAANLIADRLYRTAPHDPPTWMAATAVVVLVALLACWWPARRAARTPPAIALQQGNQA